MRLAATSLAVVALLAVPGSAQTVQTDMGYDAPIGIRGSVGATMREALRTRCDADPQYDNTVACDTPELIGDISQQMLEDAEYFCSQNGLQSLDTPLHWAFNCLEQAGIEIVNWLDGVPEYYPTPANPMPSDWHSNFCRDARIELAPNGAGFHVPAIPLREGGPLSFGQTQYWGSNANGADVRADSEDAVTLWITHLANLARVGDDEDPYTGVWKIETQSGRDHYWLRSKLKPVTWGNGWAYNSSQTIAGYANTAFLPENGFTPCPADGGGGGEFDFYMEGENAAPGKCVWYYPQAGVATASGYAYAEQVYITFAEAEDWPNAETAERMNCSMRRELIAALTQAMWQVANEQDPTGTPPAPNNPIAPDEVRNCFASPNMRGLAANNGTYDQADCTGETPAPDQPTDPHTPDDTTGGGGGGGSDAPDGWYDVPNDSGSGLAWGDWSLSMPDWFDLPSFDFSATACPTYDLDLTAFAPEWQFTLSEHCDLVEQYRAAIAALMLAVWAFVALRIVMEA